MTFASMTGFAESAGSHEGLRWRWEAKSVNSRGLDLRLRIPPGYDGLEPPARRLAGERFLRGALQISLTVEPLESVRGLMVDAAALASAVKIAREVAAETGLAPARVDGLLALKGVIVADDASILADPWRGRIAMPPSWKAWRPLSTDWCGNAAAKAPSWLRFFPHSLMRLSGWWAKRPGSPVPSPRLCGRV